jgi:hypothetical protein
MVVEMPGHHSATMRVEHFMEKWRRPPPELQRIIEATVDRLLER